MVTTSADRSAYAVHRRLPPRERGIDTTRDTAEPLGAIHLDAEADMLRKTTFLVGFGAGYVLGAKAGRSRYEQILRQARSIMGKPAVQDATTMLKDQAGSALGSAKHVVTEKVLHRDSPTIETPSAAYAGMTAPGRLDPYPA
jgi:hypothetical protein